jgi:hypothetical protein
VQGPVYMNRCTESGALAHHGCTEKPSGCCGNCKSKAARKSAWRRSTRCKRKADRSSVIASAVAGQSMQVASEGRRCIVYALFHPQCLAPPMPHSHLP